MLFHTYPFDRRELRPSRERDFPRIPGPGGSSVAEPARCLACSWMSLALWDSWELGGVDSSSQLLKSPRVSLCTQVLPLMGLL